LACENITKVFTLQLQHYKLYHDTNNESYDKSITSQSVKARITTQKGNRRDEERKRRTNDFGRNSLLFSEPEPLRDLQDRRFDDLNKRRWVSNASIEMN
jgi:hypothetical protein